MVRLVRRARRKLAHRVPRIRSNSGYSCSEQMSVNRVNMLVELVQTAVSCDNGIPVLT